MTALRFRKAWMPVAVLAAVVIVWSALPVTRRLTQRFFGSLRMRNVQTVNLSLSSFVGPGANRTLQQMVTQMIADKVTVTASENAQPAPTANEAGRLAGFRVTLPAGRRDTPTLTVLGAHAFDLTVDRARLQAILKEAGRADLTVPASVDGAVVHVRVPRRVRARYGQCPRPPRATANVATPPPATLQYGSCLVLTEGPSPAVQVPPGLDLAQLATIGLEVAGLTPAQAHQFLGTVNWTATLGLPIPRFMRSYATVTVNGAPGTLFDLAGRRGPTYTLVWTRGGLVYSLTGFGNPGDAVSLARSVS